MVKAALRLFAWLCIMALMAASWTPGQEMIRTGFNTRLEHVCAYLFATIAISIAYPRLHPMLLSVSMVAYAAILEAGQLFVAGRHAGVFEWIASSTGAMCGCCSVSLARNRS
jgi:VanZ family protein